MPIIFITTLAYAIQFLITGDYNLAFILLWATHTIIKAPQWYAVQVSDTTMFNQGSPVSQKKLKKS